MCTTRPWGTRKTESNPGPPSRNFPIVGPARSAEPPSRIFLPKVDSWGLADLILPATGRDLNPEIYQIPPPSLVIKGGRGDISSSGNQARARGLEYESFQEAGGRGTRSRETRDAPTGFIRSFA